MKFGKNLDDLSKPDWRPHYIVRRPRAPLAPPTSAAQRCVSVRPSARRRWLHLVAAGALGELAEAAVRRCRHGSVLPLDVAAAVPVAPRRGATAREGRCGDGA